MTDTPPDPSAEARKRALVEQARARARTPGWLLTGLGVLLLACSVGLYVATKITGDVLITLLAIATTGPGALVLLGGWLLRTLRGWNVVFAGLLSGIALWTLVWAMAAYVRMPGVGFVVVPACLASIVALVAVARFGEGHVIRDARTLLEARPDRDPSDAMPF